MTPTDPERPLFDMAIPPTLLSGIEAAAQDIDVGEQTTRPYLAEIAAAGLLDLGASPGRGALLEQAAVIEACAERSFSTAFSVWCHRMCIEYLANTGTEATDELLGRLRTTELIGSSAMASGFQYAAGLGELSLRVEYDQTGQLRLSGHLGWASNLFENAVIFAPAYGPSQYSTPMVVAVPVAADGVEIGPELELLALRGTASTSVTFTNVALGDDQVLSTDLHAFLSRARPVLSMFQASFCVGLATASLRHIRHRLAGVREVFTAEFHQYAARLGSVKHQMRELVPRIGTDDPPTLQALTAARLEAGVVAQELAQLETKTAGSRGFVTTSDVNRRYREATFIALQAPTEAHLRAELSGVAQ